MTETFTENVVLDSLIFSWQEVSTGLCNDTSFLDLPNLLVFLSLYQSYSAITKDHDPPPSHPTLTLFLGCNPACGLTTAPLPPSSDRQPPTWNHSWTFPPSTHCLSHSKLRRWGRLSREWRFKKAAWFYRTITATTQFHMHIHACMCVHTGAYTYTPSPYLYTMHSNFSWFCSQQGSIGDLQA